MTTSHWKDECSDTVWSMVTSHWEDNCSDAVVEIVRGLSEGDFVHNAGSNAIKELVQYRLDMCVSVWKAWFKRPPDEVELKELQELVDKKLNDLGVQI